MKITITVGDLDPIGAAPAHERLCFFCGDECGRLDFCRACEQHICFNCVPSFPTAVPAQVPHDVYDHIEDPILRESLREKKAGG